MISFDSFSVTDPVPAAAPSDYKFSSSAVPSAGQSELPKAQAAPAAVGASGSEFPESSTFRFMDAVPKLADASLLPALASWLKAQNYTPVDGASPSLAALRAMNGQNYGIFMVRSHGEPVGFGTETDPYSFGLWTSDVVTISPPHWIMKTYSQSRGVSNCSTPRFKKA